MGLKLANSARNGGIFSFKNLGKIIGNVAKAGNVALQKKAFPRKVLQTYWQCCQPKSWQHLLDQMIRAIM